MNISRGPGAVSYVSRQKIKLINGLVQVTILKLICRNTREYLQYLFVFCTNLSGGIERFPHSLCRRALRQRNELGCRRSISM